MKEKKRENRSVIKRTIETQRWKERNHIQKSLENGLILPNRDKKCRRRATTKESAQTWSLNGKKGEKVRKTLSLWGFVKAKSGTGAGKKGGRHLGLSHCGSIMDAQETGKKGRIGRLKANFSGWGTNGKRGRNSKRRLLLKKH